MPPHDDELLVVLLAEEREVGPDDVEQLGDDRRHAREVAGPDLALPPLGERPGLDGDLRSGAVHRLGRRA